MGNVITVIVLLVVIGAAAIYVIKAKRNGRKCIGCPNGGCSGECAACGYDCNSSEKNKK